VCRLTDVNPAVEPGPASPVADVHTGWLKAFQDLGTNVRKLQPVRPVVIHRSRSERQSSANERGQIAARMWWPNSCEPPVFDFWPDLVVITSAFFAPPETYDTIRNRGMKIAVLLTESPYEDPFQLGIAARADIAILNDPINLDTDRAVQPNTWYIPHAYDPATPAPANLTGHRIRFCMGRAPTTRPASNGFNKSTSWA